MKDHRQPAWAVLVCILWLISGVWLMVSLGTENDGHRDQIMFGVFAVLTLAMARSIHVLMDPEEKALPGAVLALVLVLTLVIGVIRVVG